MRKLINRFRKRGKRRASISKKTTRKPTTLERKRQREEKALLKEWEELRVEGRVDPAKALAWNVGARARGVASEDYGWMKLFGKGGY
jgi:hypothetical protein